MRQYLRSRVIRKLASAMLDGFSSRELREIADGLFGDQSFLAELADTLRHMDMVLKSVEPKRISSSFWENLSDGYRDWVGRSQGLVQRRRMSKRALYDLMVSTCPGIEHEVSLDATVREMLAFYAGAARESGMAELLDRLQGPHGDAYLEGIMKRGQERR
ncbi:MAG: hypothetical protein IMZ62_07725 [Chloroflexi bacterium]|nr:hypothetical protein [Chloroflexota bacterium]